MKISKQLLTISSNVCKLFLGLVLFGGLVQQANAAVYYVATSGNDGNTGTSWGQSFLTLQKAIEVSAANDEIWVATGTYLPTKNSAGNPSPGDARTKTFYINKNIKIYGGFNGTETVLSERDWIANVTTLSGDIGTPNNTSDNAYHVLWINYRSSVMELDGFIVTKGNANGINENSNGGGIYNKGDGPSNASNPTISNCTFLANAAHPSNGNGGAFFNNGVDGNAYPTFTNCSFKSNSAHNGGAVGNLGIFGGDGHPEFTNCLFNSNTANYGGAIISDGFLGNASVTLTNCVVSGNQAANYGGGVMGGGDGASAYITAVNCIFSGNKVLTINGGAIYYDDYGNNAPPIFTNCTFSANNAPGGGVIHYQRTGNSNPVFNNCILYGNSSIASYASGANASHISINFSTVQGGWTGGGGNNISSNPLFVNQPAFASAPTTSGDFHLQSCSPAINAGNNALLPGGVSTDLDDNARIFEETVDMGAYERQLPALIICYQDNDGDNYGNSNISQAFCLVCGDGYVLTGGDCNDADLSINPGENEVCGNNIDDNCNELVDEGCCDLVVTLPECKTVYFGYAPAASTTLSPTSTGGNGSATFLWSNGASTESIMVSPMVNTTYTITITTANNCTASASVLVESVDVRCGNNNEKVEVCHGTNTICIASSAVAAHLDHGDALGVCGLQVCEPYQPPANRGNADEGLTFAGSLEIQYLEVYPNPATNMITVVLGPQNNLSTHLTVENMLGELVIFKVIEPGINQLEIDISQLQPGFYFLRGNHDMAQRLVKH